MAETLNSQPLRDGNGRLARALALARLGHELGTQIPLLPLGAVIYIHMERLIAASRGSSDDGCWCAFHRFFHDLIDEALDRAKRYLSARDNDLPSWAA